MGRIRQAVVLTLFLAAAVILAVQGDSNSTTDASEKSPSQMRGILRRLENLEHSQDKKMMLEHGTQQAGKSHVLSGKFFQLILYHLMINLKTFFKPAVQKRSAIEISL